MRISVGNDHRGLGVKQELIRLLSRLGHDVADDGHNSDEACDYPDIAAAVAGKVAGGKADRGILVCGTGIGMAIAANKTPGIRAATVDDEVSAEISRRHNDLNILCLSADLIGKKNIDRIVEVWLTTEFDGGRHERRLNKIRDLEKAACAAG